MTRRSEAIQSVPVILYHKLIYLTCHIMSNSHSQGINFRTCFIYIIYFMHIMFIICTLKESTYQVYIILYIKVMVFACEYFVPKLCYICYEMSLLAL